MPLFTKDLSTGRRLDLDDITRLIIGKTGHRPPLGAVWAVHALGLLHDPSCRVICPAENLIETIGELTLFHRALVAAVVGVLHRRPGGVADLGQMV